MRNLTSSLILIVVLGLLVFSCSDDRNTVEPNLSLLDMKGLSSSLAIPSGAEIQSATLHVYVNQASSQTVDLHRITADWVETEVTWNNFGGSFMPAVEGSFVSDNVQWYAVDITALVQGWIDGTYDNFGILMDQTDMTFPRTVCNSRENVANQPYLEICYMDNGILTCETDNAIADAYIYEMSPDYNFGLSEILSTGWLTETDLEKQSLIRFELETTPPDDELGCRVTGGGVDLNGNWDGTYARGHNDSRDRYEFGGQAGANTALQPQPKGEWTHHQQRGPSGSFVFHAGTASAPEGTEIDLIQCSDPGFCNPARPAPAKQIDFWGVGTFKNMKNVPAIIEDNVVVGQSLHYFEVNIDDGGERGNQGKQDIGECPDQGFGLNGDAEEVDCDCYDFYRITIYSDEIGSSVIYQVYGYIQGGNLQIHPLTGYDQH